MVQTIFLIRKLSFKQSDLEQKGHAIEARIYAENPDQDFLPSVGDIVTVGSPKGSGVRFDCGYQDGNTVSIKYDPMLAKLICWAEDRDTAISKTKISLKKVLFAGLKTNARAINAPTTPPIALITFPAICNAVKG